MWMLDRYSRRDVKQRTLCIRKAVHRRRALEDLTPEAISFSLAMLSNSFLPTGELLIYPLLETDIGYFDLVETQLICALSICFPTTCTMLV